jgi:peroxiredoxin
MTRRSVVAVLLAATGNAQVKKGRTDNIYELPKNLPVPVDDGACNRLTGMAVPSLALHSTKGRGVDLSKVNSPRTVVYAYPRTGEPDKDPPPGWNEIPGARGCTPETCAFRDHYKEMKALGAEVFGMSTQTTEYQREMVHRLHVPFEVLSDADLKLTKELRLPTFSVEGMTLIKRLTLVIRDGKIEKVFYPVFPPDQHVQVVKAWLESHRI